MSLQHHGDFLDKQPDASSVRKKQVITLDSRGAAETQIFPAKRTITTLYAHPKHGYKVYMSEKADKSFTLTIGNKGRIVRLPNLRVCVTLPDGGTLQAPLELAPLLIGQSDTCDLVVADPKVSREHCALRLTDQGVLLEDKSSTNGTFVHDMRVFSGIVPLAAPIRIGDSTMVVQPVGGATVMPLSINSAFGGAVGHSIPMRALYAKLERAAVTNETIMLFGESGTGKEVLARAIHDRSGRKGAFEVLDCGALPQGTVDVELFGSTLGAFTGALNKPGRLELANHGTLFIDEIGELPIDLQPKLLRAIESSETRRLGSDKMQKIDVRIVTATHRNLKAKSAETTFRKDLYFRLAVVEIAIPSLRERKDDIPVLIERFLSKRTPPMALSDLPPETIALFQAYDWPGNVRELRNMLARLILFPELLPEMFGPAQPLEPSSDSSVMTGDPEIGRIGRLLELSLPEAREAVLEELERKYVVAKLKQYDGSIARAAEAMKVSRQLVHRLLNRYGMSAK